MGNKNNIENELNKIRIQLYEEIKGMTPEEEVAYLKSLNAPVLKDFGIKTINQIQDEQPKKAEAI